MNKQQILNALNGVDGATFAGIDTLTEVNLTGGKSNPHKGRVLKKTTASRVMLFTNKNGSAYDKKVRRHLEREGKDPDAFRLQAPKWGERIPNTPIIEHNGNHYLEVIFLQAGDVEYLLDGVPTPKSRIIGLPNRPVDPRQGGVDNKVIVRKYHLDSITTLRVNKQEIQ